MLPFSSFILVKEDEFMGQNCVTIIADLVKGKTFKFKASLALGEFGWWPTALLKFGPGSAPGDIIQHCRP